MLFVDNKDNIYKEQPKDIEVSSYMTIKEACTKWQVEGSWARRIVSKVQGSRQVIIDGRNTWIIPADAEKTTKTIKRGN